MRWVTLSKGLVYSLLLFVLGATESRTPPADGVRERGMRFWDRTFPNRQLLSHEEELEGCLLVVGAKPAGCTSGPLRAQGLVPPV